MVSLINVISRVSMLPNGGHWQSQSQATVFSVLNNVVEVAERLPVQPTIDMFAIIRAENQSTTTIRDFTYRPYFVLEALKWLKTNNSLYRDVIISLPPTEGSSSTHWNNPTEHEQVELDFIQTEEEDYDNLNFQESHSVNPGADNSETMDIFLEVPQEAQDLEEQVRSLLVPGTSAAVMVTTAQRSPYVHDYNFPHFMQKAFPLLYPYGKGGPDPAGNFTISEAYLSQMLHIGGQRCFQRNPSYIFYAYSWIMRKKVGTISYLGSRSGHPVPTENHNNEDPTVADVRSLLDQLDRTQSVQTGEIVQPSISQASIRALVQKLQPYANVAVGTDLYFQAERKKLMAMISSPVTTTNQQWMWFFTEAQPDLYLPEIYDNIVSSARVYTTEQLQERRAASDQLNKPQRSNLLRDHPFMSARVHALMQDAFWNIILQGESKPLGEVVDFWRRVEFQMRGTPHSHNLICVRSSALNINTETDMPSVEALAMEAKITKLVETVSTARLLSRLHDVNEPEPAAPDETAYSYNVNRSTYFKDYQYPCRERFVSLGRDYCLKPNGEPCDPILHTTCRRLQIANQLHSCRTSCFKYCKPCEKQVCRYEFEQIQRVGNNEHAIIVKDRDRRQRVRVKVHPPRNNGNLNTSCRHPLIACALRGNHDISFIDNQYGGAEYVSKYSSKADKPDAKVLQNVISRKIAQKMMQLGADPQLSLHQQLRIVASAVVTSQQIGAVHACYIISKQKLIKSSRVVQHYNALPHLEVTANQVITDINELQTMPDNVSALRKSPTTCLGKRDAFHALCKHLRQQNLQVNFDFFAFLSTFRVSTDIKSTSRSANSKILPLGSYEFSVDSNGFITNAKTFTLHGVS